MTSELCLAFIEVDRRIEAICRKTWGHHTSGDPKRRPHFDPDGDRTWTDEDAGAVPARRNR